MIPDFKTYIGESVWSDIHKRSKGTTVRKEEDIDLLDMDGMYDYIFSHYEMTKYMKTEPFKKSNYFVIPLFFSGLTLYYFFIKFREDTGSAKEVIIQANTKRCDEFIDKLKEFCVIDDNGVFGPIKVSPKEGKITNSFCLKVLDTVLENVSKPTLKKKDLNESVWADIHKRSNGTVARKEDDVNHMDFDTFADYIEDNYSKRSDWFAVRESEDGKSRHIEIDIISGITLSFNEVDGKIYNILVHNINKRVDVPGLKKVFNVNVLGSSIYSVLEKDWTKSNNTFVKLIEFFLDKKTNESVWADIHKRSNGTVERKEDDINLLDRDGMLDYIRSKYNINPDVRSMFLKSQTSNYELMSIPAFATSLEVHRIAISYNSKNKLYQIILNTHGCDCEPFLDDLENRFKLKKVKHNLIHGIDCIEILEKDSTVSNTSIIDLIDIINKCIENAGRDCGYIPALIKKEN